MSKLVEASLLALALSWAAGALAQDAPRAAPPAKKSGARRASAAAAPALQHPDALAAAAFAGAARRQAACITRRAPAVDRAARALDAATAAADASSERAAEELTSSLAALERCSSLGDPALLLSQLEVVDGPCTGNPLCDDDAALRDSFIEATERATPALMACYAKGLARNPDLAGDMTFEATLEGSEVARFAALAVGAGTLADPAVERCFGKELARLTLGPRAGVAHVRFAVGFIPN